MSPKPQLHPSSTAQTLSPSRRRTETQASRSPNHGMPSYLRPDVRRADSVQPVQHSCTNAWQAQRTAQCRPIRGVV
ncbi:hypothetical protein CC86DRAFT_187925 [Ophiobolus disseminans]|uniref:Uncharacterized protein n=1 Tax=Ophiobolus disseminans TaxID=1469910 RepID=A0A6A7A7P8_9PLEO|nr:hypothetical protein CC86DRAFT_187925 [Ophiobolus disseminans]